MKKQTSTKLPVYSPTKLSAFLECSLKYKFLYVEKIGRFYYRPNPGNSFGGTLHRVLESVHKPGTGETSLDELLARYGEMWNGTGYAGVEEESTFKAEGERILRLYHATFVPSDARVLLTEKQVKWEMGDFVISGRLDRMDEHPDGALEIIDYKSLRTSMTEEELRNSLAMSLYQVIVSHLYPERRVFASIHCLAGGKKVSAELSSEELQEVEERTRTTVDSIANAVEYLPKQSRDCVECDFHRLCSKQPWYQGEDN